MSRKDTDFPGLEVKMAKGPRYFALVIGAGIAANLLLTAFEAVAHNGPWSSAIGRTASGAVLFCIFMAFGFSLLSRANLEEVMLTVDRNGIWVARPRGTAAPNRAAINIPWSIILEIHYDEIGRLRETKIITIHAREIGEVCIDANLLRCGSARELYETMRRYRRRFAPIGESGLPATGQVYKSASWTGLDDD